DNAAYAAVATKHAATVNVRMDFILSTLPVVGRATPMPIRDGPEPLPRTRAGKLPSDLSIGLVRSSSPQQLRRRQSAEGSSSSASTNREGVRESPMRSK